jgi:23S rRNA (cytosine1962-C5)-methyltransferase
LSAHAIHYRYGSSASFSTSILANGLESPSYEFIDCGRYKRLERFGDVLVSRSCPSASGNVRYESLWKTTTLAYEGESGKAGGWTGETPVEWIVQFGEHQVFNLQTSPQGQIGVFPEQLSNWEWIQRTVAEYKNTFPVTSPPVVKILNGFAYTGGSTMAAHSAGAGVVVTHLDASKTFNAWAARNIQSSYQCASSPMPITKFITDDCLTYVNREIKRQNKYDMLIFDPPAFGRFDSKTWKLDTDLEPFVDKFASLLSDSPCGVVLSCHDLNWPYYRLGELLRIKLKPLGGKVKAGELILRSESNLDVSLALGCYARWTP